MYIWIYIYIYIHCISEIFFKRLFAIVSKCYLTRKHLHRNYAKIQINVMLFYLFLKCMNVSRKEGNVT